MFMISVTNMVMVGIFVFKLSITDLKHNMWEINARK